MTTSEIYDINDIMKNQPIMNLGMIGHVANGKSTIVLSLTKKITQQHHDEKIRNITIKLGYANAKIYKCQTCESYKSTSSEIFNENCHTCGLDMELINHVSLADCPGHHQLMATMLNGTCVMDSTILVESLDHKELPSPQTIEHINATTVTGTPNKIVCLNKLDLLTKRDALDRINQLKEFLSETICSESIIIPIVASQNINIDILCREIGNLKKPVLKFTENLKMIVIRSFNVNKPGTLIENLVGGVVGGSIIQGLIKKNDDVFLKPGYVIKNENGWSCKPISAKVLSIHSEKNTLEYAVPGGLIGVQLDIDPSISVSDGLVGNIISNNDSYKIYQELTIKFKKFSTNDVSFNVNDKLYINANANNNICIVLSIKKKYLQLQLLSSPICINIGDVVTISINKNSDVEGISVLGNASVMSGKECKLI